MRILVLGSEALANLLAAELALVDHDVTILAEGERYEQLRWHGVRLRDADSGAEESVPVRVVSRVDPSEQFDVVLATAGIEEREASLPSAPWGTNIDILVLPQDAERAARTLGLSEMDLREVEAEFKNGTVVYHMPGRVRMQPIGREVMPDVPLMPPTTMFPEELGMPDIESQAFLSTELDGEGQRAREQRPPAEEPRIEPGIGPTPGATPAECLCEPHGWLPTTPPEDEFRQPPEIELPPPAKRIAPEPPALLVTREAEGLLPPYPEASEGDTPWPEPMPLRPGTEVVEVGGSYSRRVDWRQLLVIVAVAWLAWLLVSSVAGARRE